MAAEPSPGVPTVDSVPLFDRLAGRYDEVLPFFATFGALVVDLLGPADGRRLLDIACGRGAVARAAAARGWQVVAVDAAPQMVSLLRRDAPEMDVRLQDAHSLDLADGTFDVAIAAFAIHCVDQPQRAVGEAVRVVTGGGYVVMSVPGPYADGGQWDAFHDAGRGLTPRADAPSVARPTDVGSIFARAGLDDVRCEHVEVHLAVDNPDLMWEFQMSHGYAGYVESFQPDDRALLEARARAALQAMHDDAGIDLHRAADVYIGRVPR